jgi:hypothetical protein
MGRMGRMGEMRRIGKIRLLAHFAYAGNVPILLIFPIRLILP